MIFDQPKTSPENIAAKYCRKILPLIALGEHA